MPDYTPPPVGSTVEVAVTGKVSDSHSRIIRLDNDTLIMWEEDQSAPSVKVLVPYGPRHGDIGVYRSPSVPGAIPRAVMLLEDGLAIGVNPGWYGGAVRYGPTGSKCVTLVMRSDGTPVEPVEPEPVKRVCVPHLGDMALWKDDSGVLNSVFFMHHPVLRSNMWITKNGYMCSAVDPFQVDRFTLLVRDSKLQEGASDV